MLTTTDDDGKIKPLGVEKSEQVWDFLRRQDFVDNKEKKLVLPGEFKKQAGEIESILRKLAGKLDIKNADERVTIRTREAVLESEEFKALWDSIKHKTTYRVEFDNDKLIEDCARAILEGPPIIKTGFNFVKPTLPLARAGWILQRPVNQDLPQSTRRILICRIFSPICRTKPIKLGKALSEYSLIVFVLMISSETLSNLLS